MNLKEEQKKPLRDGPIEQKQLLLSQKVRNENTAVCQPKNKLTISFKS